MGRNLRRTSHFLSEQFISWAAALVLLICLLPPFLMLGSDLFAGSSLPTALRSLLLSADLWKLFGWTCVLSLLVTAIASMQGIALGVLFAKTEFSERTALLWVHSFPLFLPPFFAALGWFYLFGTQGWLGNEQTSRLLFGPWGVVLVLGFSFAPIVTWMTVLSLQNIDPTLEEAARISASPARVIVRILWPIARPTITFAAMLVFALSFSELGVLMFLRVKTYPAVIFGRLGGIQFSPGEAFALSLPLLGVAALFLWVENKLKPMQMFHMMGTRSFQTLRYALGRWQAVVTASVAGVVGLSILPYAVLGWRAGVAGFWEVPRWIGDSLYNSLLLALCTATWIGLLGLVVGHALARRSAFQWLENLALFAFMLPSAVVGVGLILAWNRPITGEIYRSMGILVIGLGARYAILGIRAVASTMQRTSEIFEQTASTFGSGYVRTMLRIAIPMHRPSLIGIWLLILLFCLRDLDAVITYAPPGWATLPIRIFTLEANGPEHIVAALAFVHTAVTAALFAGGLLWLRWSTK